MGSGQGASVRSASENACRRGPARRHGLRRRSPSREPRYRAPYADTYRSTYARQTTAAQSSARLGMDVVDPGNVLGIGLDVGKVEVHDDGLLPAATQHAGQRLGVARVDLLVRDVRRHIDEIAGPR